METPSTPSTRRRRMSNMKKRHDQQLLQQVEGSHNNRRKSFALDMEQIPSFRRLNGDALFDDEEVVVEPVTPQRRREKSRRSSANKTDKSRRSSDTNKTKKPSSSRKEKQKPKRRNSIGQIEIQETKVERQRVDSTDDAGLFQDESSKSLHTETTGSMSTHSSLFSAMSQEDFFTTAHRSCSAVEGLKLEELYQHHDKDIEVRTSSKYANLGSKALARASARATDDITFLPPLRTPSDLMPMAKVIKPVAPAKPKYLNQRATTEPKATEPKAKSSAPRNSRRARRRNSLGDSSSSLNTSSSNDYLPLGGGEQQAPQQLWSLKNLVRHNRRSQQQDQLCQQFFGEEQ